MSLLGFGPLGSYPLGAVPKAGTVVSATFTSAGVGAALLIGAATFSGVLSSSGHGAMAVVDTGVFNSVLASAGHGALASVGTGVFNSAAAMTGAGGMTVAGTGVFNSVAAISGVSTFGTFSYAFFLDAERACVHQEVTKFTCVMEPRVASVQFDPNKHPDAIVAYVGPENRISIVPAENRVYQIGFEPRGPATPNRKRTC